MSNRPSRMEQLGNLLTAMLAVIVSGQTDLLIGKSDPAESPEPKPKRRFTKSAVFDSAVFSHIDRREFRQGGRYHGAYGRIAEELGVSKHTVEGASRHPQMSSRITAAILAEVARIDASPQLSPLPLDESERAQFRPGGRYYGSLARVANALGVLPSNMHRAIRGNQRSPRIIAAVRAEMARIDARFVGSGNVECLTSAEAADFKNGRKYYGLYTRVATALGKTPSTVTQTATSMTASQEMLRLLRAEMAGVDAGLAQKNGGQA